MHKGRILAALLLLIPAVSQAKTLEDLLVEKGVITKGEAVGAAASAPAKVYWNNGTRVDFPDSGFTFGLNTLIQTRYTFTDNDEDSGVRNTSSFDVHRARLIASGSALHNEFNYFLQTDFVGNDKNPNLLDAYLKWNVCDWSALKMGQFKTGLGRQFLAEAQNLQFADRTVASEYFSLGRQQGLEASATGSGVTLAAGIFNGSSAGEGINSSGTDTKHTAVLSARSDLMGEMETEAEGDIAGSKETALNVGVAWAFGQARETVTTLPVDDDAAPVTSSNDTDTQTLSVDANLKSEGASVHTEFFFQETSPDGGEDAKPISFYVQGGYALDSRDWELAARYGMIDCDEGAAGGECSGNDKLNQVTAGINYYWWAHNLKAQLNYDIVNEDSVSGDDINTNRWLLQLSSFF